VIEGNEEVVSKSNSNVREESNLRVDEESLRKDVLTLYSNPQKVEMAYLDMA
jgi:hypothetical protein